MKRLDSRSKIKNLDLNSLIEVRNYHLDAMLSFLCCGRKKDADMHFRYVCYIDDRINKLKK